MQMYSVNSDSRGARLCEEGVRGHIRRTLGFEVYLPDSVSPTDFWIFVELAILGVLQRRSGMLR